MSIRLSDAEFDLALKPAKAEPGSEQGHWRMVFVLAAGFLAKAGSDPAGGMWLGDEWIVPERYPTEEAADKAGPQWEARCKAHPEHSGWRYARAEYFPDYPGGAS